MTDINNLRGISPDIERNLRSHDVTTAEELWKRIGDESNPRIDQLAQQAGITRDELIDLLAQQEVLYGGRQGVFPRPIYALILLFVLVIGGTVIYLAGRAMWLAFNPVSQVVVMADAELPARQVIGPDDVTRKEIPQESGTFQKEKEVVGHYPLEAIPAGAKLHSDQLSDASLPQADIEARYLLSIPIKTQALSPTVRPTERVSLLLSPRSSGVDAPPAVIEDDAIVWAIDMGGDVASITVAVTQDDLGVLKSLLGVSDVFVVQPSLEDSGGIHNDPPAVIGSGAHDVQGTEGDLLEISWAFSDPDAGDSLTLTANDKAGTFTDNGDGTWSWSLRTEDDVAEDSIKVVATDTRGETATDSFNYRADNVAPTATLNYSVATTVEGPDGFDLSIGDPSDPGSRDTFEYRFDCGSGTYGDWSSSSSAHCSTDGSPATLDVRAQSRDDDGGIGKEYTASVPVSKACNCPISDDHDYPVPEGPQKPPVLTSAKTSSIGRATVKGYLVSTPKQPCVVRFYSKHVSADGKKRFIGKKRVVAGANGSSSFAFSTRAVSAKDAVVARATNAQGNISAFSVSRAVATTRR